MNRAISFIADIFFPNRCPCCNAFIKWNELICENCADSLENSEYCPICGNSNCICSPDIPVDASFCICDYKNQAKKGIIAYKSGENRNFAYFLGYELGKLLKSRGISADYIIFAPMSRKTLRRRRFNHAKIIAKQISEITGAAMLDVLQTGTSKNAQHSLSAAKRKKNVENISIKPVDLHGRSVIFCDDITTTGSTMLRCCKLIKSCGASEIYCAFGAKTLLKKGEQNNERTS